MSLPYPHVELVDRETGEVIARPAAPRRTSVYHIFERSGIPIRTTCRGHTICGLCWVHVLEGGDALPPPAPDERDLLDRTAKGARDARLACRLELPVGQQKLVVARGLKLHPDQRPE